MCHVEISPLGVGFAAFGKLFRIVVQVLVIGGGVRTGGRHEQERAYIRFIGRQCLTDVDGI